MAHKDFPFPSKVTKIECLSLRPSTTDIMTSRASTLSKKEIGNSDEDLSLKTVRIGLVGAGAIGRHHARVVQEIIGAQLVGICDTDPIQAQKVCAKDINYYASLDQLIADSEALIIATPTSTHFDVASRALNQGKHVLVEKPLAETVERARELVSIAQESSCHCVVGHVERFNPVVRWFRNSVSSADILTINITRVGPRPPRIKDVGIIIDLAVHDIDLIAHLCQSPIETIQSVCQATNGMHEDVAQISIRTESGVVAGINTNWLTPYKSRRIELATAGAFYVGDLVSGVITKYQTNTDQSPRAYTVQSFFPKGTEPLMEQALSFLNLIRGEKNSENATAIEGCRTVELAVSCLDKRRSENPG